MLSVSLECSITTELTTVGDDTINPGEVTFCNRA